MHMNHDPAAPAAAEITFDEFLKLDIRLGTIIEASAFPQARNPSYRLRIDFGPALGIRKSVAQITAHYEPEGLVGSRIMGVVNFPPRQIGPAVSEVLILGFADEAGRIVLVRPDRDAPDGARLA